MDPEALEKWERRAARTPGRSSNPLVGGDDEKRTTVKLVLQLFGIGHALFRLIRAIPVGTDSASDTIPVVVLLRYDDYLDRDTATATASYRPLKSLSIDRLIVRCGYRLSSGLPSSPPAGFEQASERSKLALPHTFSPRPYSPSALRDFSIHHVSPLFLEKHRPPCRPPTARGAPSSRNNSSSSNSSNNNNNSSSSSSSSRVAAVPVTL